MAHISSLRKWYQRFHRTAFSGVSGKVVPTGAISGRPSPRESRPGI
jgi:hypothetical protein